MFLFVRTDKDINKLSLNDFSLIHHSSLPIPCHTGIWFKETNQAASDTFVRVSDKCVQIFDGILLNSSELKTKYAYSNFEDLIEGALSSCKAEQIGEFHGQFCGLRYDVKTDEFCTYTNATNTRRVYYYSAGSTTIVATSLHLITHTMKQLGLKPSVDEIGARMLLSYGFTLGNYTTIMDVKQLGPGKILSLTGSSLTLSTYHEFNNQVIHSDINNAIPEIDRLFKKAVTQAFEYDRQNNNRHIAFLSGGLDSRMVVWTAQDLGYRPITCLNFSQPGYLDQQIANKISNILNLDLKFVSLERGEYLLNLEDNLQYNDGQILLHGAAHLYYSISQLDTHHYGIFHSGQLGDAILGSYLRSPHHQSVNASHGAYSNRILSTLNDTIQTISMNYPNDEMYMFYSRAFSSMINGDYACNVDSYSVSPFLHPEFVQYVLNVNPSLRYQSYLYSAWFKSVYPKASKIMWEKTGCNLYANRKLITAKMFLHRGIRYMQRILKQQDSRNMNPFDYWWHTNSKLRDKYSSLTDIIDFASPYISKELFIDMVSLQESGTFSEKLQVYSLLAGMKYLL